MKTKYEYVTNFGSCWRLTASAWKRFLKDVTGGNQDWDLANYGTRVNGHVTNVTNMTPRDARDWLEEIQTAGK